MRYIKRDITQCLKWQPVLMFITVVGVGQFVVLQVAMIDTLLSLLFLKLVQYSG